MAFSQPALAFLRPLPLPRPSTVRFFTRQLSNTSASAAKEDPNLVASRSGSRSYPPPSLKSQPRPKESRSSHRTSQPTRIKNYPDKNPASLAFEAMSEPLTDAQRSPNLPYYVTRTPSNELPVYHFAKGGGNKPLTKVRRIDGDLEALRDALQQHLQLKWDDCAINSLTKHVVVKGHVKNEIRAFLQARNF